MTPDVFDETTHYVTLVVGVRAAGPHTISLLADAIKQKWDWVTLCEVDRIETFDQLWTREHSMSGDPLD